MDPKTQEMITVIRKKATEEMMAGQAGDGRTHVLEVTGVRSDESTVTVKVEDIDSEAAAPDDTGYMTATNMHCIHTGQVGDWLVDHRRQCAA